MSGLWEEMIVARIVLGIGTSHGPLLSTPPEQWTLRADNDRANKDLWYRGTPYDFPALMEARGESFEAQASLESRTRAFEECQRAIDHLAEAWREARPDVAIIFGNDQREIFKPDNTPAIAMLSGSALDHVALTPEALGRMAPGIAIATPGFTPEEDLQYPSPVALNRHLFERLMTAGFDVAAMDSLPTGPNGRRGLPHAYGFVFRRVMRETVVPTVVSVFNTFYPPNQPTARRCFDFGRAIGEAVSEWEEDCRVAIIGSGGLSHFVVDEPFDTSFIEALRSGDHEALATLPESALQAGTSECKNWIGAVGALSASNLELRRVDYVPCYRTEAGTGNAQGFAVWH